MRTSPRGWLAVQALAFLAITASCSRDEDPERAAGAMPPIILISVDTLRSDHLPAYGYQGVETPAIDGLRMDGVLFERAYSHVPLTLPAHVSLLTGLLPPAHGIRDNLGYALDPATTPTIQEALRDAGYATAAGVSSFVLRRATGIDAGFDFFEDGFEIESNAVSAGVQSVQRPGAETFAAIRPWLRSAADGPFFLFFHIFEPHTPYDPPAEFADRFDSPYDGEIAAADAVVGDLLDELRALGVYDEALVVFLSDHGEGLGDHGESEHGLFLYRSTIQVPLIIKLPRSDRAGQSVDHPVSLIDVFPTVLSAIGLNPGLHLQGTPVFDATGESGRNPIYAETFFPRLHFGWSDLASLIDGHHQFIEAPRPELYDLDSDPEQMSNLVGLEAAVADELRAALAAYDREIAAPEDTDPETRKRLEALGYLGQAAPVADGALPDPKDRVGVLAEIRRAHRLFANGDLEAAVPAFEVIVAEDPGIEDAWDYLALSQIGLGRGNDAAQTYRSAIDNLPHSQRLALRASALFLRLGQLDDAEANATRAIPYDPAAARVVLARVHIARGDLDASEREARAALAVPGERRPEPWLILAEVLAARGQGTQAAVLLEEAMDDGISDDRITTSLAMTYLKTGEIDRAEAILKGHETTGDPGVLLALGKTAMARNRWSEARGWIEQGLRNDPLDPTLQLNLGLVAMREGKLDEARRLFEASLTTNPASFDGWNALGSVNARLGDAPKAIVAWERARLINPGVTDLLYNLGLANAQAGRLDQAIAYLEEYASRAQPGPRLDQARELLQRLRNAR